MLTTIHITVRDRVPTITAGEDVISHNSDYVAEFEFDEEWQDKVKTVYFVCEDGSYQAVVMSGNSCGVPMLDGEHRLIFVGVQAGAAEKPSVLKTTRPCCLKVKDSIADYLGQPIPDPTPDVYEQIIAMLNNLTAPTWDSVQNKPFSTLGSGLSVDENGVLSAQGGGGSANAVQYVAQELTDEQKAQARENIGAGTSSFSGSYNDLTSKPTIPTQVTIDSTLKQSGQAADAKAVGDALQHFTPTEALNSEFREIELTFATKLDKNQGATNAGKILGIGEDGIVVPQDKPTYTLPQATADVLGGIKADAATDEDTQDVRIGTDGKLKTKPTGGSSITVDSKLSSTSENPVQNKIITAALAEKITAPTTAAVGQIIKVKSVDGTGKPTEWEAADLPSGGTEKEWTKILEVEVTEATAAFEVTGLDNYTEFLTINSGLQNATSTDSAQNLYINGIQVCVNFVDVPKSGGLAYNYAIAKYNGMVWVCHKAGKAISATNLAPSTAYIPYNVVFGVGKATSIKMATANTTYAPVSGKITIYGR